MRSSDSITVHAVLGALQLQRHAFAIGKHESLVDQLLTGAVVLFVRPQPGERKDELDRFRAAGIGCSSRPHAGAEVDTVELDAPLEPSLTSFVPKRDSGQLTTGWAHLFGSPHMPFSTV